MRMTVLSVACPFAPVAPDTPGSAEQVLATLDRRRAYACLGGFDPAEAFVSPGILLIGHAIEEAARKGAREFHFLRGREAYNMRGARSTA